MDAPLLLPRLGVFAKLHAEINLRQRNLHGDRCERKYLVWPVKHRQHPGPVDLTHVAFDERPILGNQNVFLKRRHLSIMDELGAAVVFLCGIRHHLNNHARVEQGVNGVILELGLIANDGDVRIGI